MPRVSFAQEFKSADTDRFPKLKLDKGEKARFWIPGKKQTAGTDDDGPWMEWYHRIEAPVTEHGEAVMEVKDTKRGPVETWKMDWIGNVFCLGETGTPESPGPLMLAGIDPGNCPACESADKKTGVEPPQQRFALPVIKFKVKGRGSSPYELASPISAEVLVWAYTSRIHGMLHELEAEHGDLHRLDIKLELEDTPGADTYQKIKQLAVIVKPAYTDPKVRAYLRDLWGNEENRPTDDQLRDACLGRDVPRIVLMDMVRRAERQYREAEQAGAGGGDSGSAESAQADAGFNGDLSSDMDALLDPGPDAGPVSGPSGDWDEPANPSGDVPGDPWADEPAETGNGADGGGLDEFMSEAEKQAHFTDIEAAKQQAQREVTAIVNPDPMGDDPFAGETPPAGDVTTTGTAAPAAEKSSRTEPKSAPRALGPDADPDMLEDLESGTAPAPEPEKAAASGAGGVVDFDDLFSD